MYLKGYNMTMEIKPRKVVHYLKDNKDLFKNWLLKIKNTKAQIIILKHIDRLEEGYFGDFKSVGDSIFELRIHHSPGYRVYFGLDGETLIILLSGGEKSSQKKDIEKAKKLWIEYRRTK